MSINNFVLELDENSDKERQRRLYGHNLQFDPNRPIYQHPINLNNFLDSGEECIFRQLVKNIRQLYPNDLINKDIRLYEQVQQKINNLGDFGYNECETLFRQNQRIKESIKQKNINIPRIGESLIQLRQEVQLLENQNKLLGSFLNIDMNKKIVEKSRPYKKSPNGEPITKLQEQLDNAKLQFGQKLGEFNQKIRSQISQFQTQYQSIVYESQTLSQQKGKLSQVQAIYYEIQTEKSILSKNVQHLQDQIDKIQEKIKEEKQKQISRSLLNIQSISNKGSVRSGDSAEDTSSEITELVESSSLRSVVQINNKNYGHFKKQDNTKWFLYCLILGTIILSIITIRYLIFY